MKAAVVIVLLCAAMAVVAIGPEEMNLEILLPEEAEMMAKRDPLQYGCSGDLGLVYASGRTPNTTGCGYAQYNPKTKCGTLVVVNCKSSICADVNSGFKGRSALAYNSKLNKLEYYHTGTGQYVWAILPTSGLQNPFALLPDGRSELIGLEILGKNLYLITATSQYYIAPTVTAVPKNLTSFSPARLFPPTVKLNSNSLVASNNIDTLYFITPSRQIITYNISLDDPVSAPNLNVDVDQLQQLFYSKEAGLIFAGDDILFTLNAATGEMTRLTDLPSGARGATLSTTNYWYATETLMTKYDTKTGNSTAKPIVGGPIVGNFVYIS